MHQVYKITNNQTNMCYIGSSIEVNRRWRQHIQASKNRNDHHYGYPLMSAFREFGVHNFTFEVVETLSSWQDMVQRESDWIVRENCVVPYGYNQTSNTQSPMFDPKVSKKVRDTKREKYGKTVCEIDEDGNVVNSWPSLAEAGEVTGLDRFKISAVCGGTRLTTGNRIFRFLNDESQIVEPEKRVNQVATNRITKSSRKVVKMNDNNEEIQTYESVTLAAQDNQCDASGISKVCRSKRQKCGGFKWKFQT